MKGRLLLSGALLCALVLAAPVGAQSEMPTELWSEYPLKQKVERMETGAALGAPDAGTAIGPFLPPDPNEAAAPAESTRWSLWLALLGLAAVAVVFAARTVTPAAAAGLRHVGGVARGSRARTRTRSRIEVAKRPSRSHAPVARRQYAPFDPAADPDAVGVGEPRRYVMRRSGLLRSRFVVVADQPGGQVETVARSGAFRSVGSTESRERAAGDAWNALVDELLAAGWEPEPTRSDYYVLLHRVEEDTPSVLPTIEAYTLTSEDRPDRP